MIIIKLFKTFLRDNELIKYLHYAFNIADGFFKLKEFIIYVSFSAYTLWISRCIATARE